MSLLKESLKKIYLKDGYLFEEFGLDYFGPINGHDYDEMLTYLEIAKKADHPVLLHVITEKGKGYEFSENDEEGYEEIFKCRQTAYTSSGRGEITETENKGGRPANSKNEAKQSYDKTRQETLK